MYQDLPVLPKPQNSESLRYRDVVGSITEDEEKHKNPSIEPKNSERQHSRNRSVPLNMPSQNHIDCNKEESILKHSSSCTERPPDDIDGRLNFCGQGDELLEMKMEAEHHLRTFTHDEFVRRGIAPPSQLRYFGSPSTVKDTWIHTGQDLRLLAEAFSRSNERELVRRRAAKVHMQQISIDDFFALCSELFKEGITQERIVVLFTFIGDIAIQHVLGGSPKILRKLMSWSLRYICTRLCSWVREHGGWANVLSVGAGYIYKCTMFVCAACTIAASMIYIRKALAS